MKRTLTLILSMSFFVFASEAQTQHTFLPTQANAQISANNTYNYAYINTSVPQLHKLFLFFPGSGASPVGYRDILKTAANLGYNALGISYVNDTTVNSLCTGQGATCAGLERKEVFFGRDYSPVIAVDSVDAIRTRVLDALKYLNTTYPTEGWGQYLASPDSIIWTSVCVSGHSQGAGMASIISYWYLVDRGVFFATGGDWSATSVAAWLDSPSATPPARKYSFTHMQDELFWGNFPTAPIIWDTLGLYNFGSYVNVDTITTDYFGRHAFTSDLTISSISLIKYHNCVVVDNITPMTGAVPTYQPLWQYMLTDTVALSTGIADRAATADFGVYPNPATDRIVIEMRSPTPAVISVSDMTGRVLIERKPASSPYILETDILTPGLYIVTVGGTSRRICIR